MRPLATLLLLLGVADLVAINAVIGPAALADDDSPGAEGTRGHGNGRATAVEKVAVSAPPPMRVERAEPDLPPPRPLSVAAAPKPARDPDPAPDRAPEPDPDPDPDPAPEPARDPDPDPGRVSPTANPQPPPPSPADHPDSLPARVIVHFDLDSDELGRSAGRALDRVAAVLDSRADLTVDVGGHADESGSQEHNHQLSERRARAVVEHLEERGVDAARLSVRAFGELQPLDPGRARSRANRRVEIRFVSQNATGDPP
jgi:outer membrane protein OmpA-like peptidoglycan-associated protein